MAHAVTMALAPRAERLDPDLQALGAALAAWLEEERTMQLARFELLLEGARRPALQETLGRCGDSFVRVAQPVAVAAGSRHPERDARLLVAMVNGVLFAQLSQPQDNFATEIAPVAVRKILAAMGA